ncbi:MAG TPA: FG-GAP-like repeat-containing protein, partial [Pyrinomonadaceae bacterium]
MRSLLTRAARSLRGFDGLAGARARAAGGGARGRALVPLALILCACVVGGLYRFAPGTRSQAGGQQLAGDIVGNFSTDYQGSAVYQVPIETPPGTNGQQPNLMLVYNSQVKNGIVGMGWSLYGISSVGTCNPLIDPNSSAPVGKDPFCLDGVRLVEVSPGNYSTDKQSWARIVTRGGSHDAPETFVVTDRDGTVTEFGGTDNSRIYNRGANSVRQWMVSRVTDRHGNYVEFTYDNRSKSAGESYPQFINYTGNAGSTPQLVPRRQVEFVYEDRPDRLVSYHEGSEIVVSKRLQGVRTSVTEDQARRVVKFYKCSYDIAGSTRRSRVTSVKVFDGAGNNLTPTTLAWQEGQNALGAATELARFGDSNVAYGWGDFNGDGKADLLVDQTASPFNHWVLLSQGAKLGPPISLTAFGSKYSSYTWADLNGDGLADLLVDETVPGQSSNAHYAFLSRGTGLAPRTELRRFGGDTCAFGWTDFNGDGRADLTCDENSGQFRHWVLKSGGTVLGPPTSLGVLGTGAGRSAWVDFDGDGLSDLVFDQTAQPYLHWVRISDGSALGGTVALGAFGSDPARFTWADFNGDGLADLLFDQIQQGLSHYGHAVRLSTGANLAAAIQLPAFGQPDSTYRWLDFNGDGLADLLVDQMSGAASGHWVSLASNASTLAPAVSLGVFGAAGASFSWADVNGDGLPDLTSHESSGQYRQQARLHSGSYPDLLTRVENGIGGQTRVVYKPLTDNSVYARAAGSARAEYPMRDVQSAFYVVAEHSTNDGRENPKTYFFDYAYAGAVIDLTGRGWLGFRGITARNRQTGVKTATTYEQPFPLTGLITRAVVAAADGRTLNARAVEFRVSQPGDPGVYEVLKDSEALTYYSGKGSNLSYTIAEAYTYDAYGNVILEWDKGDTATTADDIYTCTQYLNDLDRWILGLPLQATSTNFAAVGSSGACVPDKVLARNRFTYSDDDARNTLSFESWKDTDDTWLVTSYAYDAYGNPTSVTDPASGRTSA